MCSSYFHIRFKLTSVLKNKGLDPTVLESQFGYFLILASVLSPCCTVRHFERVSLDLRRFGGGGGACNHQKCCIPPLTQV